MKFLEKVLLFSLLVNSGFIWAQENTEKEMPVEAITVEAEAEAEAEAVTLEAEAVEDKGLLDAPKKEAKEQKKDAPVIVITGSKFARDVEESVEKVDVITEQQISEMAAKNVAEVLQNVPGVTVKDHPMEGVSIQGLGSAYVKVLVDGIAVGGDVGGATPIALIPTTDIERIEIVRGASSALYGSDAMGGVVNIITKKQRNKWNVMTRHEIDIHKHYYGTFGFGYRDKIASVNAIGAFDNMPGMVTRELDPMGNEVDTFVVPANRMGYGRLGLDFYVPQGTVGFYGGFTNHDRYMSQSADISNRYFTNKGECGSKGNFEVSDMTMMNYFLSYKFFDHYFDEIYTAYEDNNVKRRFTRLHEVEAEYTSNFDFTLDHSFLVGFNGKLGLMQGIDFVGLKKSFLMSLFAQYVWNMDGLNKFLIEPGLRMDWSPPLEDGDKHLWQLTPKLNFKYNPLANLSLRFSYGMGYKVPTLKQKYWLFFHPAPVNFVLHGNPNLKPESSHGINFSIDYEPVDRLKLGARTYFNYVRNLIFAVETSTSEGFYPDANGKMRPVTGTREYRNIDRVMTTGASFSLDYKHQWVETHIEYTVAGMFNYSNIQKKYLHSAYFVPHQLKFDLVGIIPKSFTRIKFSFNWAAPQDIRVGFDSRAADMIKLDDENYGKSPDKLIINLHISQKFWEDRIELYGGVRNLFHNLHFMKGSDGKTQSEYFGMIEGATPYFGIGIKY